MKDGQKHISIGALCKWFGISCQFYYQHEWKVAEEALQYDLVLSEIKDIRQRHPFSTYPHSDRGSQYCANLYVNLLKKKQIKISMAQNGDPLENAVAERVNGIIKDEYLPNYQCDNIKDASKKLSMAVWLYNNERPHSSIGNLTPEFVHAKYHQISNEKIKKIMEKLLYKKNYFYKPISKLKNDCKFIPVFKY